MQRLSKAQRIRLWLDRLNRFSESQQTAAQFCQSEHISLPSFYQWRRRLSPRVETARRRRTSRPGSDRLAAGVNNGNEGFTELIVQPTSSRAKSQARPQAHARLTNGITITLGNDPELVRLIIDRLLKHEALSKDQGTPRPC